MGQKYVFISHIHEEAHLAKTLKCAILEGSRQDSEAPRANASPSGSNGSIDVYVSSDDAAMRGEGWFEKLQKELKKADLLLVLCSWTSRSAGWLMFEAGGAWARGVKVVPVCHSGRKAADLDPQLHGMKAIELEGAGAVDVLFARIAHEVGAPLCVPSRAPIQIREALRSNRRRILWHHSSRLGEYFIGPLLLAVGYYTIRRASGWSLEEVGRHMFWGFLFVTMGVGMWHGANRPGLPPMPLLVGQGLLLTGLSGSLTGGACELLERPGLASSGQCEQHIRVDHAQQFWLILSVMPFVYALSAKLGAWLTNEDVLFPESLIRWLQRVLGCR